MCAARAATGRARGTTSPTSRDRRSSSRSTAVTDTSARQPRRATAPRGRVPRRAVSQTPASTTSSGSSRAKLIDIYKPNDPAVQGGTGSCSDVANVPRTQQRLHRVLDVRGNAAEPVPVECRRPRSPTSTVGQVKKNDPGPARRLGRTTRSTYTITTPTTPPSRGCPSGPANENQDYKVDVRLVEHRQVRVPPSGNNSGHCIDPAAGGGPDRREHPGGGIDSNVRAYKLCDPTYQAHVPGNGAEALGHLALGGRD